MEGLNRVTELITRTSEESIRLNHYRKVVSEITEDLRKTQKKYTEKTGIEIEDVGDNTSMKSMKSMEEYWEKRYKLKSITEDDAEVAEELIFAAQLDHQARIIFHELFRETMFCRMGAEPNLVPRV